MDDVFDPKWVQAQQVIALRAQAQAQNDLHGRLYEQASKDWVQTNEINRDRGIPITPVPAKPRKQVVSDDGTWSEVEWTELPTPVLPPPGTPSSNSIWPPAGSLPPDRIDQLMAQNAELYKLMQRIAAKVGA